MSDVVRHRPTIPFRGLITEEIRLALAAKIIELVNSRFNEGLDAHDLEASPYSPKGPVYLPLHGGKTGRKSGGTARYTLNIHKAKEYRNRALERAEEEFAENPTDNKRMLAAVRSYLSGRGKDSGKELAEISGSGNLSSTGNSMRFPDYSAMKVFLGYPPYRNLMLSGAMRRAITLTGNTEKRVSVGFLDDTQAKKMRGNQRWADMWGLSPKDRKQIEALFKQLVTAEWQRRIRRA